VARFLSDGNPRLVIEAARAIYDEPIDTALPKLAALANAANDAPAFWRRAHSAAYLVGSIDNAADLAAEGASGDSATGELRALDALDALAKWNSPRAIDRLLGTHRVFPPGRINDLNLSFTKSAVALRTALTHGSERVRIAALGVVASARLVEAEPETATLATDGTGNTGQVRAAALRALAALGSTRLRAAVEAGLDSSDTSLREAARKLMVQTVPERAVGEFEKVLARGSVPECQEALGVLATLAGSDVDRLLATQLDALGEGRLAEAVTLDLLEAAARRPNPAVRAKLASFEANRKAGDLLASWRECLKGGDVKRGEVVFTEHAAGCMRCHKVNGAGGDVGPDLRGLASRMTREQILTAIVDPNASIASGYENVALEKTNGEFVAGVVVRETADELSLKNLEDGAALSVKKTDIKKRTRNPSPMTPDVAALLGKRNLRDLVEYLAGLRK
jgi:quinoprotein glucose dehydrogenase